ncbi:probable C-terminal domain small phosphatase [Selaginella moellendorffii]|uniref:probable C-terminal domain small phosphatase n=1 Tax=Selaginella moellendorffii TaxID=88036 RepID=UPI000D1C7C2A|nr:probable C-terminal domain small phosphatase [Selaginella moellendorffii]|eukprot:XP_024524775.1 probable C-terminal domain small phosphatase [Selaginella moellendorffii]
MEGKKPLLVLDMDGTLITSCNIKSPVCKDPKFKHDFALKIPHSPRYTEELLVTKRPGLDKFLRDLSSHFHIIVFSHSPLIVVNKVFDVIDPSKELVSHRIGYDSCPKNIKNLEPGILGLAEVDLKRTIWIDDSPLPFSGYPGNGIVVPHFGAGDHRRDRVLIDLVPVLVAMSTVEDVRESIALYKARKWWHPWSDAAKNWLDSLLGWFSR